MMKEHISYDKNVNIQISAEKNMPYIIFNKMYFQSGMVGEGRAVMMYG